MELSNEELVQRYSQMDEYSLVELYVKDTLTIQAEEIIQKELVSRNISLDRDYLRKEYAVTHSTAPSAKESAHVAFRGALKIFIIILILIGINVVFFGFGKIIAPVIWSSQIDKECQAKGYWYGSNTDNPDEIMCSSWWVT